MHKSQNAGLVVAGILGGTLCIGAIIYYIRKLRMRYPNPKYVPTPFLKRLWTNWKVKPTDHRYQHADDEDADAAAPRTRRMARLREPETIQAGAGSTNRTDTAAGVDRNTSIRSVMTLPAYNPQARETEQVLGREGERGGIDVVVEMPTAEDEEELRENEMSTLYQVRLARNRQIEERSEYRQLRREARQRNGSSNAEELRRQAREAREASERHAQEVEELRREHERIKNTRQRAVSSVSYDGLGVARADGTRIRANSIESERMGLLSDAASIAPSARSVSGAGPSSLHQRLPSAGSVISLDDERSLPPTPNPNVDGSSHSMVSLGRARSRSRGDSAGHTTPRAGSSPEMIYADEADIGEADMPLQPPPGYEDVNLDELSPQNTRSGAQSPYEGPPPDYPGPTQARLNRLSAHMAEVAAEASGAGEDEESPSRRTSRGLGGTPQLPSLRLSQVPQIVIEPSTAHPDD